MTAPLDPAGNARTERRIPLSDAEADRLAELLRRTVRFVHDAAAIADSALSDDECRDVSLAERAAAALESDTAETARLRSDLAAERLARDVAEGRVVALIVVVEGLLIRFAPDDVGLSDGEIRAAERAREVVRRCRS